VDRDQVWQLVDEQRAALADLLETLAPDEWERPSLCAGWRVRDVAAHVISSPQSGFGAVSLGLMRAKGNFNRCIFDEAKRAARAPTSQIVADYRRYSGSRRRPPGTTYLDPLLDVLVHTQDIAIPLGRRHDMPPTAACAAASRVWGTAFPFRARKNLAGLRLVADDVPWSVGDGPGVQGAMASLLLVLTGRSAGVVDLTGDGVPILADRLSHWHPGGPATRSTSGHTAPPPAG
jgi:uncharacterized protein (TIGR03083 family)